MNSPMDGGGSQRARESSGDFDLNLAPIIDCFTVIIAFLLASAAFVSIGVFEAVVPSLSMSQGKSEQANNASLDLVVEISKDKNLQLSWSGVKTGKQQIGTTDGTDLGEFKQRLKTLRESVQKEVPGSLEIRASDVTSYSELIALIEAARPHFSAVIIGGL